MKRISVENKNNYNLPKEQRRNSTPLSNKRYTKNITPSKLIFIYK